MNEPEPECGDGVGEINNWILRRARGPLAIVPSCLESWGRRRAGPAAAGDPPSADGAIHMHMMGCARRHRTG